MKLFFTFVRLGPTIIFNYFRWIRKCAKNPDKLPIEVKYKRLRKLIIKAIKVLKLDIKVNNIEYITKQENPVLITCNHRFFLDPIFFMYLSEKPVSFIAKKELKKVPVLGKAIAAVDGYFIERDDLMSQVRLFKNIANTMKNKKISYLIFPEGTRMKDKEQIETLPYKDGSIKLAYWAGANIIPAAMIGNERALDKKRKEYTKINITISLLEPYEIEKIKDVPTTKITPEIYKNTNIELLKIFEENETRNTKNLIQ